MTDNRINSQTFSLPEELQKAVEQELDAWKRENKIGRLWQKDQSVWTNSDEAKWLGWLDIVERQLGDDQEFEDLQFAIHESDFVYILLMGMGGSSLCPEVLEFTFGQQDGFPKLYVLDSTVPAQVEAVEEKIDLKQTLFIVASKSGTTLEPNCFKQYFFERLSTLVGRENAGKQFIAITDPGSKMQRVAESDGFWKIFFGDPQIGGRFSALSDFGMIPASAMGIDANEFLLRAKHMVDVCKSHLPPENPGVVLGTILGVAAKRGRDKLTIIASPGIARLGAWLEQLIAESTGKNGVSIIPIDGEPILAPENYGDDRIFVCLRLAADDFDDSEVERLAQAGQPVVRIDLPDVLNLGQEFFRWEIATAVAGAVLGINPFDQPDVEFSKIETRKLTAEFEETGKMAEEKPFYSENGIKLFTDEKNLSELDKTVGTEKTLKNYLRAHLSRIKPNDYFALLAYVEMSWENESGLSDIRLEVLEKYGAATCLGFGPRFLHSTGQAYKGGANNGVFLQITSDDREDFAVPEQKFTFGAVKAAQARGDFQVLVDRDRRALRVHLGSDTKSGLEILRVAVEQAAA